MCSIGFAIIILLSVAAIKIETTNGKLTTFSEEDEGSVFRCCLFNHHFNLKTHQCESSGQALSPNQSMEWQVPRKFRASWLRNENITLKWREMSGLPPCNKSLETVELNLNGPFSIGKTKYRLTDKGILVVTQSSTGTGDFRPLALNHRPKDFCIDVKQNSLILQVCPPQCEQTEPCMRKCCEVGRHLRFDHEETEYDPLSCENSHHTKWKLPLYESPGVPLSKMELIEPRYNVGFPLCDQVIVISAGHSLPDGKGIHRPFVVLHRPSNSKLNSSSSWIVHQRLMKDGEEWSRLHFDGDACYDKLEAHSNFSICPDEDEVIIYCIESNSTGSNNNWNKTRTFKNQNQMETDPWEIIYKFMSVLALFFLLITILILFLHTATKEVQNIHSWTRFAYVTTFFIVLLLLTISAYWSPPTGSKSCAFWGGFLHFMELTTISWLSVINFDLWYVFKVLKPTASQKLDVKRFLCYFTFALGLPLIIILIGVIIQSYKPAEGQMMCRSRKTDHLIYPNYGEKSCNLSRSALGIWLFTPLGILLLINFLFLITTTWRMVKLQRMASRASMESTSGQRQSVQLFFKIFIVSGVTWNFEIISWLLREYLFQSNVKGAWYLLDLAQHFQAAALFVIFVCKRDVLRTLQTKFPIINKVIPQIGAHQSATMGSFSTDVNGVRKYSMASSSGTYQRKESIELKQISPVNNTAKSESVTT